MKLPAAICRLSFVFLPLEGEDQGGGEQIVMLPPHLTSPPEGGEETAWMDTDLRTDG